MGKLMLVDDDRDDRHFFLETLRSVSSRTDFIECKSGREALSRLATEKNLPDVIFLDINMPGMSGWELLTTLKRTEGLREIPVIMYSTSSHDRDVRIADDFGAIGFCTKPENVAQLKILLEFVTGNLKHLDREKLQASGLGCLKTVSAA